MRLQTSPTAVALRADERLQMRRHEKWQSLLSRCSLRLRCRLCVRVRLGAVRQRQQLTLVSLQLAAVACARPHSRALQLETAVRSSGSDGGCGCGACGLDAAAPRAPGAAVARARGPRGALRVRGHLRHSAALRPDVRVARRPARVRRTRALHLHCRMHFLAVLSIVRVHYKLLHINLYVLLNE